jgi:RNA polymerase-binding transcription factor DksA
MATHRKSGGSKPKAKKPVKKAAARPHAKRAATAAKRKPKKSHAAAKSRPAMKAKPASKGKPAKALGMKAVGTKAAGTKLAGGKSVGGKVVVGKAVAGKTKGGKAVPPVKLTKAAQAAAKREAVAAARAAVRPLGVLPPESMARPSHRPAPPVVARPTKPIRPAAVIDDEDGITEADYPEFEQRLLEERRKILKEMGHLENTVLKVNPRDSAGDLSGYSFHMADVGTDSMEREKAFLFASTEGRLLMEINEALRRLYTKAYGNCEECGRPIARARLEAMPYARLCLRCKEKEERAARGLS